MAVVSWHLETKKCVNAFKLTGHSARLEMSCEQWIGCEVWR